MNLTISNTEALISTMQLSIITPTFNSAATLEASIQSVINQTGITFEHIIIDGNSTDETINIINKYPHLKWLSEPDEGIYDAMNKGVELAKGEWIYFLGGDDQLKPGILQEIEPYFNKTDLDMFYGNIHNESTGLIYDGYFDLQKFINRNICQQAIFYKTLLLKKRKFNLNYKLLSDYECNIVLYCNSRLKKEYVNQIIANYSGTGQSNTNIDDVFLIEKVKIFANVLKISRFNKIFDNYRHQEAINQILFGSIILGFIEMTYHVLHNGNLIKSYYTAFAMLRCRFFFKKMPQTQRV